MCYACNQWYDISCATLYISTLDIAAHVGMPELHHGTIMNDIRQMNFGSVIRKTEVI